MQVIFDHREKLADNISTFWFQPVRPVSYRPGQFIQLYLPHAQPDSRGMHRWFTLSSSPTEPLLSITTKFAPNGSSFKRALQQLQPGTELHMEAPSGDFILPNDPTKPLAFVAGGIGITPMRSMLTWLRDTNQRRPITLIQAASNPQELVFAPFFQKQPITYIPIVTQPTTEWHGETGHLDAQRILALSNNSPDCLFYLSGPEPLIKSMSEALPALGVTQERIITDFFPGYTQF